MAGVVDGLQRHAAGEGAIANDGNTLEVLAALVPGQGHAEGRRNRGAGVARTEVVEGALAALQITRNTVLLTQGVEVVVATGDQLMGIGLVAHIPNDPILVEVKGVIESQGEFHHPQTWAEVATARAHHVQVTLADLAGNAFELSNAEAMQLIGMRQLAEMHACGQD